MPTPLRRLAGLLVALLPATAFAQSLHIDIGGYLPAPLPSFGAVNGLSGTWNDVDMDSTNQVLVDLAGQPTAARVSWPAQGHFDDGWMETGRQVGRLLDDYQLVVGGVGAFSSWNITGLEDGVYRVTFYSKPTDEMQLEGITRFVVQGGERGSIECDSRAFQAFAGFRAGINFAQDYVTVSGGLLQWRVEVAEGPAAHFCGLQLEKLVPGDAHTYCQPKTNSLGCTPTLSWSGTPSLTSAGLLLRADNLRSSHPGMLVWSRWQNGMPHLSPTGLVCISRPFRRTVPRTSGGSPSGLDCTGSLDFLFDASFFTAAGLSAGDSVCCQFWTEEGPGVDGRTQGFTFVIAP
jgi:hypothetical protein